ncbi:MAG: branched-chain amino acid ABC transporter substrate-binding protein [Desulfobacterales bacterium GWB2_56_26]|nr:MAG: branched-chain amino acid ABC transporter substrate-binding protein [Desulfobacterales bacterium GWB2_56_26]
MGRALTIFLLGLVLAVGIRNTCLAEENVIRIGFNIAQTGMFELVGKNAINAGELVRQDIEKAGGLTVGGKSYKVEFLYGDHTSDPSVAAALAVKQVSQEKVLGIIGPLISRQAIPVAQMAQAYSTPMITPWSTSPLTTQNRPFVFRTCFVFTIQGPAITKFAASQFNATKAAVLYDIISAYPRGMANSFKEAFEAANGPGSVVAFEEFRTGDVDFSKQMNRIKESGAQFLFTPQHYNEVPLIVRQAKALGLTIPVVGSNSWAGGDLIGQCGTDCNGLFFTGNYAPGNAKGLNKSFVEAYTKAYGSNPDEPAALTWDAARLMVQAIKNTGGLTGDLVRDRIAVKDALAKVKDFDGATGKIGFDGNGDPSKCTVIVKIDENGVFTFHDSVCP